jgi:hypothetical protein
MTPEALRALHPCRTSKEALAAGATTYFTGKPCKRGHIAFRFSAARNCSECHKTIKAEYRERHPEKDQEWRDNNKERRSVLAAFRYQADKERHKARNRRWREENPDHWRACRAAVVTRRRRQRAAEPLTRGQRRQVAAIYRLSQNLTRRTGVVFNVDHHIPLAKGGTDHPSNLWVIPEVENFAKRDRLP